MATRRSRHCWRSCAATPAPITTRQPTTPAVRSPCRCGYRARPASWPSSAPWPPSGLRWRSRRASSRSSRSSRPTGPRETGADVRRAPTSEVILTRPSPGSACSVRIAKTARRRGGVFPSDIAMLEGGGRAPPPRGRPRTPDVSRAERAASSRMIALQARRRGDRRRNAPISLARPLEDLLGVVAAARPIGPSSPVRRAVWFMSTWSRCRDGRRRIAAERTVGRSARWCSPRRASSPRPWAASGSSFRRSSWPRRAQAFAALQVASRPGEPELLGDQLVGAAAVLVTVVMVSIDQPRPPRTRPATSSRPARTVAGEPISPSGPSRRPLARVSR